MTVRQLYTVLSARMPESDREEWDNDGVMCAPDLDREVRHAVVALDVTEEIADYALEVGADLIVSHHPLIFHPVRSLTEDDPTARKLMKLSAGGVAVFSFHTRADKAAGGVNDLLADALDLADVEPFGEGGLGRIGNFEEDMSLEEFAFTVKEQLGSPRVILSDGYKRVRRVAVVGGDGKSYIAAAAAAGADTFLSGRIGYNVMEEAAERDINLVEAGHFYTENRVTEFFSALLSAAVPDMEVEIQNSNNLKLF